DAPQPKASGWRGSLPHDAGRESAEPAILVLPPNAGDETHAKEADMKDSWTRVARLALTPLFFLALAAPSMASSHREAPGIATDPAADNTDVYFFRDPVDPSRLVMIGNWIPLEEPAGGPNFYHFEPNIRYEFNVDSNGDALEDLVYRLTFTRNVRN